VSVYWNYCQFCLFTDGKLQATDRKHYLGESER